MRYLRLVALAVSLLFVLPCAVQAQAGPPIIATSVVAGCNGSAATLTIQLNNLTYSFYGSSGLYYHFDAPSPGTQSTPGIQTVLLIPPTLTPGPHTLLITTSPASTGGTQSQYYSFIMPSCGGGSPGCVPPPNTTMVAWYPFDELQSPTAANFATGNTGIRVNDPTPIPTGKVNAALRFDGIDDYVESPSTIVTNFGPAKTPAFCSSGSQGSYSACLGNFSIDVWIRTPPPAATGIMLIVDKRSPPPSIKGYSFFLNQATLGLQLADGMGTKFSNFSSSSIPSLYDGNWHHIAVTVDRLSATGIRWYHNGVPIAGPTGNPTGRAGSLDNNSPLRIGTRTAVSPLSGWFRGDMDELEIFNRVLTVAEVSSIHGAGPSGKCKSGYLSKGIGGARPVSEL